MTDYLSTVDWSRAQFAMTAAYHWLFVPLTLGLSFIIAIMETCYVRTGDAFWKRTTKFFLDAPLRHQFRHRRRHGADSRIRVRHQLVQLLALRGRHLRRSAGRRRHFGLLYRIHVHRRHVLRLAKGLQTLPPRGYVAHSYRGKPIGVVDSGSQLVDAISRGVHFQPRNRSQRDDLVLDCGAVARGCQQVLPYRHLVVRARGAVRRGRLGMVPAAPARTADGPQEHRRRLGFRPCLRAGRSGDRAPLGGLS